MTNGKTNLEKYSEWVKDNYTPSMLSPNKVEAFISPSEEGLSISLLDRVMIYSVKGFNVCLNGGTGSGKSTLLKNVAALMNLPYYKQTAHSKFTFADATVNPTYMNDTVYAHPGPLMLSMLFDGIYHLEEAAGMDPSNTVNFHDSLDRKSTINTPTHFGNISIDLESKTNHFIVWSGNFNYQKPDLNPASTQRFVWVDVPYLDDSQLKQVLISDSLVKDKITDNPTMLDSIINKQNSIYGKQEITDKTVDALMDMLIKIKNRTLELKNIPHQDRNAALLKRVAECYSPQLGMNDYLKIIEEVVLYPIAARQIYCGDKEVLTSMNSMALEVASSYKSLFNEKVDAAKVIGLKNMLNFIKKS